MLEYNAEPASGSKDDTMKTSNKNKGSTRTSDRVHEKIVESLGRDIVSGKFPPGHSLGHETTTGESFKASRTAMREALKALSSKGLIESRPKVGTTVKDRKDWNLLDPQILNWSLQDPAQTKRTMQEIFEIRMAFEPFAAAQAAQFRTDQDIQSIRRALRGMAHYVDNADKAECDLQFHKAILQATGNSIMYTVGELISVALQYIFRAGLDLKLDDDERWLRDHKLVATAIENGAPEKARQAMEKLLVLSSETHLKRM
jgi:DNA-binding FadR family transcriptional regulator